MERKFGKPRFDRGGDRGSGGFRNNRFGSGGGSGGFRERRDDFPKPVNEGEEYDVEINEVGTKGDGIARVKNFVIFVADTKEGEKCRIKITMVRPKFAVAEKVSGKDAELKEPEKKKSEPAEEVEEKTKEVQEKKVKKTPKEVKEEDEEFDKD